jgi:hypothetical protein
MEYFIINKVYLLSQELDLSPSVPLQVILQDWIRYTDGKLSFIGFVKLLHGMSSRSLSKMRYMSIISNDSACLHHPVDLVHRQINRAKESYDWSLPSST